MKQPTLFDDGTIAARPKPPAPENPRLAHVECMALSIRQPWASMIASGEKTIETRTWPTKHRGPLLILSTKAPTGQGPTGCALALVTVTGCRRFLESDVHAACCDWDPGKFAWLLADIRPIHPVPARGAQWLFRIELDIEFLASNPNPKEDARV